MIHSYEAEYEHLSSTQNLFKYESSGPLIWND